jgi:hypothetical protein
MGSEIMKTRICIVLLVTFLMMSVPTHSNAFAILRYTFDAIANQFGLDRGPIPKEIPKNPAYGIYPNKMGAPMRSDLNRTHIQAEGF